VSYGLALYHQARILALKGDAQKAIALYKKAKEKPLIDTLRLDVEQRVSLLEAKK